MAARAEHPCGGRVLGMLPHVVVDPPAAARVLVSRWFIPRPIAHEHLTAISNKLPCLLAAERPASAPLAARPVNASTFVKVTGGGPTLPRQAVPERNERCIPHSSSMPPEHLVEGTEAGRPREH
jgi:hypothetical protein